MSADLELVGLSKSFGGLRVVDAVDLRVEAGELVALLGPSGCGKTTALRMIAGLERADAGSIRIAGEDVTALAPEKRRLGMVFQSYAVFPHRSVAENVAYPLQVTGAPKAEIPARVLEALRAVQLEGLSDRRPHQLSGGQLQRVAMARALVANPRLLLLDEPMSNLDAALREELRAELAALRARIGVTTVLVTHDQAEALSLADRVAVMNSGRLEQVATPRTIYAEPKTAFVAAFVGANVLEGEVRSGVFETAGVRFVFEGPDGRCLLAVRPESVRIGAPNGTLLPVTARLFQGRQVELRFQLGARSLRAIVPPETEIRPGQTVRVSFSDVYRFD